MPRNKKNALFSPQKKTRKRQDVKENNKENTQEGGKTQIKEKTPKDGKETKSESEKPKKKVSEGSCMRHRHLRNCLVWDKKF